MLVIRPFCFSTPSGAKLRARAGEEGGQQNDGAGAPTPCPWPCYHPCPCLSISDRPRAPASIGAFRAPTCTAVLLLPSQTHSTTLYIKVRVHQRTPQNAIQSVHHTSVHYNNQYIIQSSCCGRRRARRRLLWRGRCFSRSLSLSLSLSRSRSLSHSRTAAHEERVELPRRCNGSVARLRLQSAA